MEFSVRSRALIIFSLIESRKAPSVASVIMRDKRVSVKWPALYRVMQKKRFIFERVLLYVQQYWDCE